MPGRATSPPLTVTVVAALWVSVGRAGVSGSPGHGCDNGKLSLDRDLPADAVYWDCPVSSWTKSSQRFSSIDTVYDPEPARPVCMDKPISYNYSIPNSGTYRPVSAASGEYLYCPPQRWLNNLHHGATVLLYHPCAPLHERLLLSALARSCLSDYILTPHHQLHKHMPLALVSWGRTLEASTVASSQICDWLESTRSTRSEVSEVSEVSHSRRYNLLLIWPAEQRWHSSKVKGSLKQCCEQTITQLLNEVMKAEQRSSVNARGEGQMEEGDKSRQRRAAEEDVEDDSKKDKPTAKVDTTLSDQTNETGRNLQNYNSAISQPVDSPPGNRNASDHPAPQEAFSQTEIPNQNLGLALTPKNPIVSNFSRNSDSSRLKASQFHKPTTKPGSKQSHLGNSKLSAGEDRKDNHSVRPETLTLTPKHEDAESDSKHIMKVKTSHKDTAADGKMKDNDVIDVEEREVDPKQRYSHAHSHNRSQQTGFDSQQNPNPQPVSDTQVCGGCTAGEPCECPKGSEAEVRAAAASRGLLRTPRTDEAVWAAAALGFLLVLLTLSVLHTRLYRHWRTAPSLYWHDPRQDYDSVADVIRRRLQISKRRRKRGRRQECVLLPSSSSSDEYP